MRVGSQQRNLRFAVWRTSLIRILYCPTLSPESASRRLPGGLRRSSKLAEAYSWGNLRNALSCMSGGSFLERIPCHIFSVSLLAKETIIFFAAVLSNLLTLYQYHSIAD